MFFSYICGFFLFLWHTLIFFFLQFTKLKNGIDFILIIGWFSASFKIPLAFDRKFPNM